MVKLEWGTKRTCQSCSSRFYDLQKSPIVCPKCGATYEIITTSRRGRKAASKAVTEDEVIDQDVELDNTDDDSLLDDDEDLDADLDNVDIDNDEEDS